MNIYLVKSIKPTNQYTYLAYLSKNKELSSELQELIESKEYELLEIPIDTPFTNFKIVSFLGKTTLEAEIVIEKKKITILFNDINMFNHETLLRLLSAAQVKKNLITGKVFGYYIQNQMLFNITHPTDVESFLKEIQEIRENSKAKPEPKPVPKPEPKPEPKPAPKPKKPKKYPLDPFTIYKNEEGEYFYVLALVNTLPEEVSSSSFFKKIKRKIMIDYILCLDLPKEEMIDDLIEEKEIVDAIVHERYRLESDLGVLEKLHYFKKPGRLDIEELLEIHNRRLIDYLPYRNEKCEYSSHKKSYNFINYHALISLSGPNWLSHADYFLYMINQPMYQALLTEKSFNKSSIIEELFNRHETKLIDIFNHWHKENAKIYATKQLNGKVLWEDSFVDYACFIAQHIIENATKNQLFMKNENQETDYPINAKALFESIKALAIDTEQTYQYALLKNGVTIGIQESRWQKEHTNTYNVPNKQDFRKITTLYGDLYPEHNYYEQIFGNYENMVNYFKNR